MNSIKTVQNGRDISIELPVSDSIKTVEVVLSSDANCYIFEYSDVSPITPGNPRDNSEAVMGTEFAERQEERRHINKGVYFPVVDIAVQDNMQGVLKINKVTEGQVAVNGNFHPESIPVSDVMYIPSDRLEHWGNGVFMDSNDNTIESFSLKATVDIADGLCKYNFKTLHDDWSGKISIYTNDGELLGEEEIEIRSLPAKGHSESGLSKRRMLESLSATVKFILNCRNLKRDSTTFEGLFLLYDLKTKNRLMSDWTWAWGPAATLLLRASELDSLDVGMSKEELRALAIEIADASLRQQITDPDHPARGLVRTTNEFAPTYPHGFINRASAADTLYLAGWGWMPFYKSTGEKRYLEATVKAAEAAGRLMDISAKSKVPIPQAYDLKKEKWDGSMFFESSMGLGGLGQLYVETDNLKHKKILVKFVDLLLATFQREDGLWETNLNDESDTLAPCNYFTKSFGYNAEGLIAVHEALPEGGYLERAEKMADYVLKAQAEDGSWTVRWDCSAEEVGITEKGTALWALLFLRLFKITGKEKYHAAAMKALEWCMDNQYFGDDSAAVGGIVARSWTSGILFRHWFDMVTTYSMAFFGNALVESLEMEE